MQQGRPGLIVEWMKGQERQLQTKIKNMKESNPQLMRESRQRKHTPAVAKGFCHPWVLMKELMSQILIKSSKNSRKNKNLNMKFKNTRRRLLKNCTISFKRRVLSDSNPSLNEVSKKSIHNSLEPRLQNNCRRQQSSMFIALRLVQFKREEQPTAPQTCSKSQCKTITIVPLNPVQVLEQRFWRALRLFTHKVCRAWCCRDWRQIYYTIVLTSLQTASREQVTS